MSVVDDPQGRRTSSPNVDSEFDEDESRERSKLASLATLAVPKDKRTTTSNDDSKSTTGTVFVF